MRRDQRYYSSQTARFLTPEAGTPDNAVVLPQNWNKYAYVGGDPVNKTDPTGLCSPDDNPPCYSVDAIGRLLAGGGAGGGGVKPPTKSPLDPLPMTVQTEVALIADLRRRVAVGTETDCEALAEYLDALGAGLQGTKGAAQKLKSAVILLTPNQFPIPILPGVTGSVSAKNINNGSMPSGFESQFQDQIPNADQVHHFAAFFQLGFSFGADVAGSAASWWEKLEGTPGNAGDIKLGRSAALIGSYVKSGVLPVDEVGNTVRQELCEH